MRLVCSALVLGLATVLSPLPAANALSVSSPTYTTQTGYLVGAADPAARAAVPGPHVLNEPLAVAPQFTNAGVWHAKPTTVCLTSDYSVHEFVYQGCVYDDQGAQLLPTKWPVDTLSFSYTYPTNPIYRANIANLLEVRLKPVSGGTAIRLTFNSMTNPGLVGTTIALGNSSAPAEAPYGANTAMPAQRFITVHGTHAVATNAATGHVVASLASVSVDQYRRQITLVVPNSVYNPGSSVVRVAAASGLWDVAHNRYLTPQLLPNATTPGGAIPGDLHPSAFFDVAFRYHEPFDSPWRDDLQKKALAAHNISQFYANVNFATLRAGTSNSLAGTGMGVPKSGFVEKLFSSHIEIAQGRRLPSDPGVPPTGALTQQNLPGVGSKLSMQFGWVCRDGCVPDLSGRIQRYVAYVPSIPRPASGYASLLWTPGYAQSANDQVNDPNYQELFPAGSRDLFRSFANRPSAPTVVIDVDGRGNDEWYYGLSGANVFEALADARAYFHLDPKRTVMAGFSSGAYGANKLSLTFPDVFSKAFICDGLNEAPSFPGINGIADVLPIDTVTQHTPGSSLTDLLPSRRNQPVVEWSGVPNDYIPADIALPRHLAYMAGSYDYQFDTWIGAGSEHVVLCADGAWNLATQFLGNMSGDPDPFHVTYVRNPAMDDPKSGLVGDHAYWLSQIATRSTDPTEVGTIDVVSEGFGLSDGAVNPVTLSVSNQSGTTVPINLVETDGRAASVPVASPKGDVLNITATNIAAVTINPGPAHVDCKVRLNVKTDGPVLIRVLGCGDQRFS